MMSTQPPDTAPKQKSRRSLLPSLHLGSSSSASSSSPASMRPPCSSSALGSSAAQPDYFATVHVPDAETTNAVRIVSPFALATPLVSSSSDGRLPSRPNTADLHSRDAEPHPWAKLFPDAGMTTALPDRFRMPNLAVPPTPAANPTAVPIQSSLPSPSSPAQPPDSRRNLYLPPQLNLRPSSSASLPLPARSSSSHTKSSASTASTADLTKFKALDVDALADALLPSSCKRQAQASSMAAPPPTSTDVLILDIRPSTSYSIARIASSINICAPSTLLKRPAITVERIEDEMLGSSSDRRRFMRWRNGPLKPKPDANAGASDDASLEALRKRSATITLPADEPGVNKIIVLDTDTSRIDGAGNATAGGGGPCLIGVLKKFEAAGFAGELCWLVGGFNKLARCKKAQQFIHTGAPDKHAQQDSSSSAHTTSTPTSAHLQSQKPPELKLNGVAAPPSFASPAHADDQHKSLVQPRALPIEAFQTQSTVAGWPGQSTSPFHHQAQPGTSADGFRFNLAARSHHQHGHAADTNRTAHASAANRSAAACANPFFDNIRQNRELQHGITEKIPMELPHMNESQTQHLPPFLQKLIHLSQDDRALALAQAFFEIEKAEQNRLIATMQQHSAESDHDPRSKGFATAQAAALLKQSSSSSSFSASQHLEPADHSFPFSIAAALERGADNRYNNIWTYEHSRVRLSKPQSAHDPGSDYINGSFVHPPHQFGSKRRYIATQAPLPSTFDAFWTAVWEQNSRVIVMLTREHESGRLQSHPYWLNTAYGDALRLTKLEEVVLDQAGHQMRSEECSHLLGNHQEAGALFPTMPSSHSAASSSTCAQPKREPTTVRRTLLLRNLAEPQVAPRKIVQLQYIAWPDYHIPETPQSLLTLIDLADSVQNAADAELRSSASRGRAQTAGPMVVHCSAGVGRTGAFIVIDAALDVLRRVRRRQKMAGAANGLCGISEPTIWENDLVATTATRSPTSDGTRDADMVAPTSPLADRFPRTPRRSLKRELSPTGMDIDSGSNHGSTRDLSSPPPMFRSRSNESGTGADAASLFSSSLSSTGSFSTRNANAPSAARGKMLSGDTPMRSTQSMQAPTAGGDSSIAAATSGFTNPFSSPVFRFNPLSSARIRHMGSSGTPNSLGQDSACSPRQQHDGGLSANDVGSDPASSPTRLAALQLSSQDAWRQVSSPFSEVSTPSFQGGGSARSSFSSAAGVHSRLSSGGNGLAPSGSEEKARSIDEALMSAVNPSNLTILQQGQSQDQACKGVDGATAGDTTTSTITGSNEPTPFDASSSTTSNVFGFTAQPQSQQPATRAESMSASNSAGSTSSFMDAFTQHTPNTSAHSTPANATHESQTLLVANHSTLTNTDACEADEAYANGQDVIRSIVEAVRQQRMSLIQTARQFVFVYSAVLAGLLSDLSREGVV